MQSQELTGRQYKTQGYIAAFISLLLQDTGKSDVLQCTLAPSQLWNRFTGYRRTESDNGRYR